MSVHSHPSHSHRSGANAAFRSAVFLLQRWLRPPSAVAAKTAASVVLEGLAARAAFGFVLPRLVADVFALAIGAASVPFASEWLVAARLGPVETLAAFSFALAPLYSLVAAEGCVVGALQFPHLF